MLWCRMFSGVSNLGQRLSEVWCLLPNVRDRVSMVWVVPVRDRY